MKSFNVMALDAQYQIVSLLRYTNLQWNRKYHESGFFSIQIPLSQYASTIKYIYTKDRPELGKVSQVNYVSANGYSYIQLSGYFLENELNRRVVYPYGYTNIVDPPAWIYRKGKAEDVAIAFFDAFKNLKADTSYTTDPLYVNSYLGIDREDSKSRGNTVKHTRNGEKLGEKIYDILKPSGMSYRVAYDFTTSKRVFSCLRGTDRRSSQSTNNPIVFSTKYGNIKNPNILMSETEYRNACIVHNSYTSGDVQTDYSRAVFNRTADEGEYDDAFLYVESSLNRSDYDEEIWYPAIDNDGVLKLGDSVKTVNVEFDAMEGSYEYGADFDIGDYCSIEIPEIEFSADARLIGCYEVVKSGKWSLTLEFGTPLIRRIK